VFGYGCYLCPIFLLKKFILGKRWGFWGFNNEPPQGMLCLVIGLLRVHSKKMMETINIVKTTQLEDIPTTNNSKNNAIT